MSALRGIVRPARLRRAALGGLTGLLVLAHWQPALAGETPSIEHGKALHEAYCLNCHGTEVYTKPGRRMQSVADLRRQIERCKTSLGTSWPKDDIRDLVHYLNEAFYHFDTEGGS